MSLTGWRRNAVAFIFGALATLTLAPFYLFPLIVPAFTGLYWLTDSAPSPKRVFWDGWWWGWGFYVTGLYWLCEALLVDPAKFGWLIPFALFGVTGVIAIYAGVACWLTSWARVRGLTKLFVFSVIWTCVAFARGHLFTGFPWNLEGYAFGFSDAAMQSASLVGAYGLTWFAVFLGGSFAVLLPHPTRREGIFLLVVWGAFAASLIWGQSRLQPEQYVPGITLRLVQGNVPALDTWEPDAAAQGLQTYMRLTQSPGLTGMTAVIWPESSVPYVIKADTPLTDLLGHAVPDGTLLIAGGLRSEGDRAHWKIWNSLTAFTHSGAIAGAYDKVKLVPFGEFLPFRSIIPKAWLTPVGDTDFSSGKARQTLVWPGLPPLRPLICYEAIFPELSMPDGKRPAWLLNVTNDAWFGASTGPHQHFAMARMRAVEQGVPLVRAANTGISAIVDSYGRVVSSLPLGTQGVLDGKLPVAQAQPTTYGLYGNGVILLLIVLALALKLIQQRTLRN